MPSSPASTSSAQPTARYVAASVLVVGGALAFGASFLPFWEAAYPATNIDPAVVNVHVPAAELIAIVQDNLSYPASASFVGTAFLVLMIWGAPLLLATLGVASLLKRRWTPGIPARVLMPLLATVGLGFTAVMCWGYMNPIFGSQGATRSLSYGTGVTIAGYVVALVGAIWLPATAARLRS